MRQERNTTMDRVTLVKREVQAQEWSTRIQACRESGMSIPAWCRENGIAAKTYYYHLRKLREKRCEQIPVAVTEVSENTDSVITVSSGSIRVEIRASASAEGIAAVVRALKC